LDYDGALAKLRSSGANTRCKDLTKILEDLGFKVRDGNSGAHKVFDHPSIPEFSGSNYNCGHGRNPQVRPGYVNRIITVVERLETEIRTYLKNVN